MEPETAKNAATPAAKWTFLQVRTPHAIAWRRLRLLIVASCTFVVQCGQSQIPKRRKAQAPAPHACFLHSSTRVGGKMVVIGGSDYYGAAIDQLFVYDTDTFAWTCPRVSSSTGGCTEFGAKYGHTATLIDMHPPRLMVFGGMATTAGVFTFENGTGNSTHASSKSLLSMLRGRNKGDAEGSTEEPDNCVFFLTFNDDRWTWSKPILSSRKQPQPRAEHAAAKARTNEVMVFGGWADRPVNDLWSFDHVNLTWEQVVASGVAPRPRYRHTCEALAGKFVVLGGSDNGDDEPDGCDYLGIHVLDLETVQWSHPRLRGASPFPRSGHSSCVIGGHSLAIFGGRRTKTVFFNDVCILNVHTMTTTFVDVRDTPPVPISNMSMDAVGSRLFVFGGTDAKAVCYEEIRTIDIGQYLDSNDITVLEGSRTDYAFKILVIGDSNVGKSALLTRFAENLFIDMDVPTIGIDFNSRKIRVDEKVVKLEIWDTAGQERFNTITSTYYRGAHGALLVYDITDAQSFRNISLWRERALTLGGEELEMLVVGNKLDLDSSRQVSRIDAQKLAAKWGVEAVECSALTAQNVERAFMNMARRIKHLVETKGYVGIQPHKQARQLKVEVVERETGENNCCLLS